MKKTIHILIDSQSGKFCVKIRLDNDGQPEIVLQLACRNDKCPERDNETKGIKQVKPTHIYISKLCNRTTPTYSPSE